MTDTTLSTHDLTVPVRKVVIATQTVIESDVEIEIPDVDAVLDEAFSHLAHHVGTQQGNVDLAIEHTRDDEICQAALRGYLDATEDFLTMMGHVRVYH